MVNLNSATIFSKISEKSSFDHKISWKKSFSRKKILFLEYVNILVVKIFKLDVKSFFLPALISVLFYCRLNPKRPRRTENTGRKVRRSIPLKLDVVCRSWPFAGKGRTWGEKLGRELWWRLNVTKAPLNCCWGNFPFKGLYITSPINIWSITLQRVFYIRSTEYIWLKTSSVLLYWTNRKKNRLICFQSSLIKWCSWMKSN